jgi:hypothetical protein
MASRSGNMVHTDVCCADGGGVSQLHVKDYPPSRHEAWNFLVFIYAGGRFIIKVADFGGLKGPSTR